MISAVQLSRHADVVQYKYRNNYQRTLLMFKLMKVWIVVVDVILEFLLYGIIIIVSKIIQVINVYIYMNFG